MELRTNGDRAVLVGPDEQAVDPYRLAIPAELSAALHEWARVVAALGHADAPQDEQAAVVVSRRGRQLAERLADVLGGPVRYHDPLTGEVLVVEAGAAAEPDIVLQPRPEPTPWLTGLTVSVVVAVVALSAVLTLAVTLVETSWLLAVAAVVLVTGGLLPSVWLARRVLVWRWVALGVACGLGLGWVGLVVVLFS